MRRAAAEAVAKTRAEQGRVAARRLNRIEYENTLRDLLGVDVTVRDSLPADTVTDGFDNQSSALHTSSFLLDRYLDAADVGLDAAIANRPRPTLFKKRIRFQDERVVKIASEPVYRDLGAGSTVGDVQFVAVECGDRRPVLPEGSWEVSHSHFVLCVSKRRQAGDAPCGGRADADGAEESFGGLLCDSRR
ncbi:MAG: DUF1587 domain-containing protein [Pirellulales bacterium]